MTHLPGPADLDAGLFGPGKGVYMAKLVKIWNLRADSAWIETVKIQAIECERSNPGRYVRDLVWTISQNPTIKNLIFESLQGVDYGNSR